MMLQARSTACMHYTLLITCHAVLVKNVSKAENGTWSTIKVLKITGKKLGVTEG